MRNSINRIFERIFELFGASTEKQRRLLTASGAIVLAYLELLIIWGITYHIWILDAKGHPLARDFVMFWSAGQIAAHGSASAAYNPFAMHAAEVAAIGHPAGLNLGWYYPPLFFFPAVILASLPYAVSFAVWCFSTLAFQASVVAKIAGQRIAFMVALAAPLTLLQLLWGQNGAMSAGLAGLALLMLEERPALSGLLLGALTYEPQLGILFPFALAAGGYWRAFFWAAIGAVAWNGLAAAIFGFDTIAAFFHALPAASQAHLSGATDWRHLQSVFGLARSLGISGPAAMAMQIFESVVVAIAVMAAWWSGASYYLKAATLAATLPLATPFILAYNLAVLAVAVAFLFRDRPLDRIDIGILAIACPLIMLFLFVPLPTAFIANLLVAGIVARRWQPMVRNWRTVQLGTTVT